MEPEYIKFKNGYAGFRHRSDLQVEYRVDAIPPKPRRGENPGKGTPTLPTRLHGALRGAEGAAYPYLAHHHSHLNTAVFLTAMIESMHWGTVQSYDGCGMSAGPLHSTAVLPNNNFALGPLWGLLQRIGQHDRISSIATYDELMDYLESKGLVFNAMTGIPVSTRTRRAATGYQVSEVLTPPAKHVNQTLAYGTVGPHGPGHEQAKQFCILFANLFSDPATYLAQIDHSIDWLLKASQAERNLYALAWGTPGVDRYYLSDENLGPAMSLALAVYHSFSVNAPAVASSTLATVLAVWNRGGRGPVYDNEENAAALAGYICQAFKRSGYGMWGARTEGRQSRYEKTRAAASKLGVWDEELINAVMQ